MIKYTVIGGFFGLLLSFILPFVFAIFASALAGGLAFSLSGAWLYYAAAIPFVLTFSILGSFFWKKGQLENKNMWLLLDFLSRSTVEQWARCTENILFANHFDSTRQTAI